MRIKGRDNPLDTNFQAAKVELRISGDLTCIERKSSFEILWMKPNNDVSLVSPEAWIIRNGKKIQQLKDENFVENQGKILVNLGSFSFDHLDNFQLYIFQSVTGRTWIDSILNGPIVIYDEGEAPVFSAIHLTKSTATSLSLTFDIYELGQTPVTEIGISYGVNSNPTISDSKIVFQLPYTNKQTLSTEIITLLANTEYHFRVYSIKASGVTYSRNRSFYTALPDKPIVSKPSYGSITSNSISVSSTITNDGGGVIRETGFLYNTTGAPDLQDLKVISALNGSTFTSMIVNLQPSTKYFVAAYAKNDGGTTVGAPVDITTNDKPCVISQVTTGRDYSIQVSSQSGFKPNGSIRIYWGPSSGTAQAWSVKLYDGDSEISNFGNYLLFKDGFREFTLPNTLQYSSCYNIRIVYYSDIYVSSRFTVNP